MAKCVQSPSLVEACGVSFLICDAPNDDGLSAFIETLIKYNVHDVVRISDKIYNAERLATSGIRVWDWPFPDGDAPPEEIISKWLMLVEDRFKKPGETCIAVHCVAGLGRAPALVVIALIERGMKPEDAIDLVRSKRKGAINSKQLRYLIKYKPRSQRGCCIII
eukprot:Colp12_sorted_trinity150504_noHs@32153